MIIEPIPSNLNAESPTYESKHITASDYFSWSWFESLRLRIKTIRLINLYYVHSLRQWRLSILLNEQIECFNFIDTGRALFLDSYMQSRFLAITLRAYQLDDSQRSTRRDHSAAIFGWRASNTDEMSKLNVCRPRDIIEGPVSLTSIVMCVLVLGGEPKTRKTRSVLFHCKHWRISARFDLFIVTFASGVFAFRMTTISLFVRFVAFENDVWWFHALGTTTWNWCLRLWDVAAPIAMILGLNMLRMV